MRQQMAEDSKADYSLILQRFNQEQWEYYHTHIPNIFQKIQEMEERRIVRIGESMKTYAEVDRQVIPIIGKCLDGIVKAAESIDQKNVSAVTGLLWGPSSLSLSHQQHLVRGPWQLLGAVFVLFHWKGLSLWPQCLGFSSPALLCKTHPWGRH